MLTIQIPESHHTGAVSRFIEEHRLHFSAPATPQESMVLIEDGNILGYGAYRRQGDEAAVTVLFIDPAMRKMGFGDGLFRALLNLMERTGIRHFFISANGETKGFLTSEDLAPSEAVPVWAEALAAEAFWFEGTLPEFFQKPCKGGRLKR